LWAMTRGAFSRKALILGATTWKVGESSTMELVIPFFPVVNSVIALKGLISSWRTSPVWPESRSTSIA
jgi:hypothetical protein